MLGSQQSVVKVSPLFNSRAHSFATKPSPEQHPRLQERVKSSPAAIIIQSHLSIKPRHAGGATQRLRLVALTSGDLGSRNAAFQSDLISILPHLDDYASLLGCSDVCTRPVSACVDANEPRNGTAWRRRAVQCRTRSSEQKQRRDEPIDHSAFSTRCAFNAPRNLVSRL